MNKLKITNFSNFILDLRLGLSYAVGSVQRKGIKAKEDGETVALLKSAGGIPLLVSNTPEFCTSWESTNLITGRTKNPYDTRHSSGGSSGGEVSCFFYVLFSSSSQFVMQIFSYTENKFIHKNLKLQFYCDCVNFSRVHLSAAALHCLVLVQILQAVFVFQHYLMEFSDTNQPEAYYPL